MIHPTNAPSFFTPIVGRALKVLNMSDISYNSIIMSASLIIRAQGWAKAIM